MSPSLFGCVITSIDDIIIVGQPSVGSKGSFHTFKIDSSSFENEENDFNILSIQQYSPKDGHSDDGFGISAKITKIDESNHALIIGAHRHFEHGIIVGAAYIYNSIDNGQSWTYSSKLLPNKHINKTLFGCSVDIQSDFAVVGAFADNTEGWRVGSVHMFKKQDTNTWAHHRVFYPNLNSLNRTISSNYGFSIALSDNFLAIGAPGEESNGSVYIYYSNNRWIGDVDSQRLQDTNRFGFSLDLTDDSLLVGAPGENGMQGKTHVYKISSFFDLSYGFIPMSKQTSQTKIITTKSRSSKALFGRSLAANNKFAVVSGFGKTEDGTNIGSAFLYKLDTNTSEDNEDNECELLANMRDATSKELFGHGVMVTDKYVFVGDPSADKVHVYEIDRIIGGSLKKWYGSSMIIEPLPSYSLELS